MKPTIKRRGIKPAFALSVLAAALFGAASASASYVEQGLLGDANSWKSAEFMKSWGPRGMKAEKAYALGFYGQGANVGVMDSGTLASHVEFDPTRFTYVVQKGTYGSDGERFRGSLPSFPPLKGTNPKGAYKKGEAFDVTGAFDININDSHGTKVAGVIGASRDGSGMHGIAWGAHVTNANTGGSDENNYGPFQDYNFFLNGWGALVEAGAQVINNSWGTNVRIVGKSTDKFGPDYGKVGDMLPTNTVADVEYEYFYFKKMYGDNYNFVDAAWHAVKDTPNKVVQIMTTGNRDMKNPFHRALYPYFHPEAENQWIAVAGIQPDKDLFVIDAKGKNTETRRHEGVEGHLILQDNYNEAGFAKWWTVVGPTLSGSGVSADMVMETSAVKQDPTKDTNDPNYKRFYPEFDDEYGTFSGTSCAAPHVAGAMGVLLSRYANMNSSQVRDVMFTTATHKNTDGTDFEWWTAEEGTPDERYGWGLPDLEKGMYGPGQFLGAMEYNASVAPLDVWTNDISQVALEARKVEDQDWLDEWNKNGIDSDSLFADGYSLGDTFVVNDNDKDDTNHIVDIEDAKKWRQEYAQARADAIQYKLDNDLYTGKLIKRGAGTLVMTGFNTYKGGTTVKEGALYGFTGSFGEGKVVVDGGLFGIISEYEDTFTQKGKLTSESAQASSMARIAAPMANVEVNNGGTYVLVADQDVQLDSLTFNEGSRITVGTLDKDLAVQILQDDSSATGTLTVGSLTGFDNATVSPDYAFLHIGVSEDNGVITAKLSKNAQATGAGYGESHNGKAIGAVLDKSQSGAFFTALAMANKDEVKATLESLGNDFYLSADSASVVNALKMSRSVKDAAQQAVSVNDHSRLWASVNGSIGSADFGQADFDVDSQGIMIGAEIDTSERHTAGVFFGTGKTKFKGGKFGKIDSDDLTVGVYGQYNAEVLAVDYGVMHTKQDREGNRLLLVGNEAGVTQISPTTQITQAFAELAYTGFSNDKYSVEPYAGLNIMKVKSDGYNEAVGQMLFTTEENKQTLEIATVGVRGSLPFAAGGVQMAVKGDLSAAHFFGDTTPEAVMHLADTGVAKIEGGKLKNIFGVGLGVEAQLCPVAKVELSYNGAYNSDVKSSGVSLNLRMSF